MNFLRKNQESEVQQNLGEMLNTIEKKYQVQIQEMTENNTREIETLEEKCRKYERELHRANDQLHLDSHAKWGNQFLNERKFNEMLENEKRLIQEITELKNDNEKAIKDSYKTIESEREQYKMKISEVERKAQESE